MSVRPPSLSRWHHLTRTAPRFFHRMGRIPSETAFPALKMENVTPAAFASTWESSMEDWGTQIKAAVDGVAQMLGVGLGVGVDTIVDAAAFGPHLLAPTATDLVKYGHDGESGYLRSTVSDNSQLTRLNYSLCGLPHRPQLPDHTRPIQIPCKWCQSRCECGTECISDRDSISGRGTWGRGSLSNCLQGIFSSRQGSSSSTSSYPPTSL